MNNKYPVASVISLFLRAIGIIVLAGSICFIFYAIFIYPAQNSGWGGKNGFSMFMLMTGFIGALSGMYTAAIGEIIDVLLAIEFNTRNLYELQKSRYSLEKK